MDHDPFKKFLLETGLSYTDVLKKLKSYKDLLPSAETVEHKDAEEEEKDFQKTASYQQQEGSSKNDIKTQPPRQDEHIVELCDIPKVDSIQPNKEINKANMVDQNDQSCLVNTENKLPESQLSNSPDKQTKIHKPQDTEENCTDLLCNEKLLDDDTAVSDNQQVCQIAEQENVLKDGMNESTEKDCIELNINGDIVVFEYNKENEKVINQTKLQNKHADNNKSTVEHGACNQDDTENKSVKGNENLKINIEHNEVKCLPEEVERNSEKDKEISDEDEESLLKTLENDSSLDDISEFNIKKNYYSQMVNNNNAEEVIVEVQTRSYDEISPSKHLNSTRRRIMRKYKNIANSKRKLQKCDNNVISPTAVEPEDIHAKLKEQLELLRTKRKSSNSNLTSTNSVSSILPQRNTTRLNFITSHLKRKLSICIDDTSNEKKQEADVELKESNSGEKINDTNVDIDTERNNNESDGDISLSTESGFMISNVIGGYRSPSPEVPERKSGDKGINVVKENDSVKHVHEDISNRIVPTKTSDVTKIKGWKKKRFANKKEMETSSDKSVSKISLDSETSNQRKSRILDNELLGDDADASLGVREIKEANGGAQSAFISDQLDQYLTENSQLNISYEIPKLKAEQSCKQTYIDIKFPTVSEEQKVKQPLVENKNVYKPKTLAEKRKMLAEKVSIKSNTKSEVEGFMEHMNTKQRKACEKSVSDMRQHLIKKNVPFTRRCFMASTAITNTVVYVIYNGRKIKVSSPSSKRILMEINERRKSKTVERSSKYKYPENKIRNIPRQRKPSLLNQLKKNRRKLLYDPDIFETVKLKLPKVILQIKPMIGRSINPKIKHLIERSDDTILDVERVEFALSVLKTNGCTLNKQIFSFPLTYKNNQTDIEVIKERNAIPQLTMESKVIEDECDISKAVSNIVDKIITYVEIKEATADILTDPEITKCSSVSPQLNKSDQKKRKGLISDSDVKSVRKTTLEMKRLNCKIVSISLDEDDNADESCQKDSCQLGCVCKSIECNPVNLLTGHCGLPDCMFKCSCNNNNKGAGQRISLPAGADLFSERVINRLEDEAKKNLAKVEKEFTQTVIKTNNQIIMVGDTKERKRRIIKAPKKFSDFVDDLEGILTTTRPELEREVKEPVVIKTNQENEVKVKDIDNAHGDNCDNNIKSCWVSLIGYNFNEIIPYCMVHNLYKCHCKNKSIDDINSNNSSKNNSNNIIACRYVNPAITERKNRLKSITGKGFNKEIFCSRTRGLPTSYYLIRNKSVSHRRNILRGSKRFQKQLEKYLRANAIDILKEAQSNISLDIAAVFGDKTPESELTEISPPKDEQQKQSSVVLEDSAITSDNQPPKPLFIPVETLEQTKNNAGRELKLQRRRRKSVASSNSNCLPTLHLGHVNKQKNSQLISLLGKKDTNFRLLYWPELSTRFEQETLQLWYSNSAKPCPIIVTENYRRPTTHHYNIKSFEWIPQDSTMPSDIIQCLISKKVPLGKLPEDIGLVLAMNKFGNWEIHGLGEKTLGTGKHDLSFNLIQSWKPTEEPSQTPSENDVPIISLEEDNDDKDNILEIPKKTKKDTVKKATDSKREKMLYINKKQFQIKKLMCEENKDDTLKVVWAPLPTISGDCQWRVINLNPSFSYFSLTRCNYTIRYDDIVKTIKVASINKLTIVLKSYELLKFYKHRNFGIYCVHNYSDKIFIGPYALDEHHDIDTYTPMNNVMVNTTIFYQIQGKSAPDSGYWYRPVEITDDLQQSTDDDVVLVQDKPTVVDLTIEDSDEEKGKSKVDSVLASLPFQPFTGDSEEENNDNKNDVFTSRLSMQFMESSDEKNSKDNSTSFLKLSPRTEHLEKETEEAEKTLDMLLKKGQLNVNKTLICINDQNTPTVIQNTKESTMKPKTVFNRNDKRDLDNDEDIVEKDDTTDNDDKLIIDEETDDRNSLLSTSSSTERIIANNSTANKDLLLEVFSKVKNYVKNVNCLRYLVTNVLHVGYILAYKHDSNSLIDVTCPVTKKIKRFANTEAAVNSLERVLSKRFILVPSSFKLEVKLVDKLEAVNDFPLQRVLLNGFHIVGTFGTINIQYASQEYLKHMGFKDAEITYIFNERDNKFFWNPVYLLAKLFNIPINEIGREASLEMVLDRALLEIKNLEVKNDTYIKEKIELESQKVGLAEKCAKLQSSLSTSQQEKSQKQLDQIIQFSNKSNLNSDTGNINIRLNSLSTWESVEDKNKKNSPVKQRNKIKNNNSESSTDTSSALKLVTSPKLISVNERMKSLLTGQIKNIPGINRNVVLDTKQNIIKCLASANDMNKQSFHKNSNNSEEKLLIKDFSLKVPKEVFEKVKLKQIANNTVGHIVKMTGTNTSINNNPIKGISNNSPSVFTIVKKNNSLLTSTPVSILPKHVVSTGSGGGVLSSSNAVLRRLSSSSLAPQTSDSVKPTMAILTPVSLSKPVSRLLPKPMPSNSIMNTDSLGKPAPRFVRVSSISSPTTSVPATVSAIPPSTVPTFASIAKSIPRLTPVALPIITSSSATTLSKPVAISKLVVRNGTLKTTPSYVTVKDGEKIKCFQVKGPVTSATVQSSSRLQAIKRPASSVADEVSAKKVASSLLLTNQTEKTEK